MQACDSQCDRTIRDHVFMFPGQGSQALGMGAEVRNVSARVEAVWDCASDISGVDVRKLCQKGPMTRLSQTRYQQLAVTTVNAAMFERLREIASIEAPVMAGHSVGEYAALYAGGAFDLPTLFEAVDARASLMQEMAEQRDGAMYVIKDIGRAALQRYLDDVAVAGEVQIANDNSPRQQVLSGDADTVRTLAALLQRDGYGVLKLPVNGAWHSPLMAPARDRLHATLSRLPVRRPATPVYMNLTAEPAGEPEQIVANLSDHLTHTVRWRETMESVRRRGYGAFFEVGMRKMLGGMLAHDAAAAPARISCFADWR